VDRGSEIEILAATLEEPFRALVRAAGVALRQGRLDAAARVMGDQVGKRPGLAWAGLLLALEAAEWRLAGAVQLTTPKARFAASESGPSFTERWGDFTATVYPACWSSTLRLEPLDASTMALTVWSVGAPTPVLEAVTILRRELEACLGRRIEVWDDQRRPWPRFISGGR
jgi:hypothetical protein